LDFSLIGKSSVGVGDVVVDLVNKAEDDKVKEA